jgi:hypothetical protein
LHDRGEPIVEGGQDTRLIVYRNDHRILHHTHAPRTRHRPVTNRELLLISTPTYDVSVPLFTHSGPAFYPFKYLDPRLVGELKGFRESDEPRITPT